MFHLFEIEFALAYRLCACFVVVRDKNIAPLIPPNVYVVVGIIGYHRNGGRIPSFIFDRAECDEIMRAYDHVGIAQTKSLHPAFKRFMKDGVMQQFHEFGFSEIHDGKHNVAVISDLICEFRLIDQKLFKFDQRFVMIFLHDVCFDNIHFAAVFFLQPRGDRLRRHDVPVS